MDSPQNHCNYMYVFVSIRTIHAYGYFHNQIFLINLNSLYNNLNSSKLLWLFYALEFQDNQLKDSKKKIIVLVKKEPECVHLAFMG